MQARGATVWNVGLCQWGCQLSAAAGSGSGGQQDVDALWGLSESLGDIFLFGVSGIFPPPKYPECPSAGTPAGK